MTKGSGLALRYHVDQVLSQTMKRMEPNRQARPQDWFDLVDEAEVRRRRGAKWNRFGDQPLAAWVADMDFPAAPPIAAALAEMAATGDYGYPFLGEPTTVAKAFASWSARRHGWEVDPERVMLLVDVLQPIVGAIEAFSEPGDGVLIQTPIYPPFLRAVEMTGRVLVDHPLGSAEAGYPLDVEALQRLDPRTRIILLCNPHNPSGRVFRREELEALAEVAVERNLLVASDEIHADLVYQPHRHIPFASLSPEAAAHTITLTSSTKTFNIAGLRIALVVFGSGQSGAVKGERIQGVLHVVDGDTIVLGETRIRLEGIDAPETTQDCSDRNGGSWKCGDEATRQLIKLIGALYRDPTIENLKKKMMAVFVFDLCRWMWVRSSDSIP